VAEDFGVFGDSIGGLWNPIVSIAGFIWLKRSLDAQKEALVLQKEELQAQKYEIKLDNFRADFNKLIDVFVVHNKHAEQRMRDLHHFIEYRLICSQACQNLFKNIHFTADELQIIERATLQINQEKIAFFAKIVEVEDFTSMFINIAQLIEQAKILDEDKAYFYKLLSINTTSWCKQFLFFYGLCNSNLKEILSKQAIFKSITERSFNASAYVQVLPEEKNFVNVYNISEVNLNNWVNIPFKTLLDEKSAIKLCIQILSPY
jgi:hypothetical protein